MVSRRTCIVETLNKAVPLIGWKSKAEHPLHRLIYDWLERFKNLIHSIIKNITLTSNGSHMAQCFTPRASFTAMQVFIEKKNSFMWAYVAFLEAVLSKLIIFPTLWTFKVDFVYTNGWLFLPVSASSRAASYFTVPCKSNEPNSTTTFYIV